MRWTSPLLIALLLVACGGEDAETANPDDAEYGDSLPAEAGKADGYGVPKTLGLDKRGIVYLTFDDGPSPAYTARILDILARHHAKATFFITGANIAGNEALLRRERDDGHFIGNHQWQHVVATLAQFQTWVPREKAALAAIVGTALPPYFRYPYGAMTAAKETVLKANGYPDGGIGWDIDSLDWDFGPDARASRPEVPAAYQADFEGWVLQQVAARGGGVILFHDIQSITAGHLDSILGKLEARGLRFGTLPATRPVPRFIGDACSQDAECNFDGGFCLPGPSGGTCTRACTGSCPDKAGYPVTRCVRAPDGAGAAMDLCAVSCGTCGVGRCQTLTSPSGVARSVCWQ